MQQCIVSVLITVIFVIAATFCTTLLSWYQPVFWIHIAYRISLGPKGSHMVKGLQTVNLLVLLVHNSYKPNTLAIIQPILLMQWTTNRLQTTSTVFTHCNDWNLKISADGNFEICSPLLTRLVRHSVTETKRNLHGKDSLSHFTLV